MEAVPTQHRRGVLSDTEVYPNRVMYLLRRAASETRRALGINIPTALLATSPIVLKVAIVDRLSTPEVDSPTGSPPWVIELTPWLVSFGAVFLVFFSVNILKVKQRDRSVAAHQRMIDESAASVDDRIRSFLRNSLSDPSYGVAKCYAFGSVVRSDPTRDVDIIIQFDYSERSRVRACRNRLRNIETSFEEFHGLKLHIQTFLSNENAALDEFLIVAGQHERLI